MNSASQCEVKEDKRKHPRLVHQISVKVHIKHGLYADDSLHDLLPDGLQIRCDQETVHETDTIRKIYLFKDRPSVSIKFALRQTNNITGIVVKCSVCYFVSLPLKGNDDVASGLQFRQFSGDSPQQIKHFFPGEMEPVWGLTPGIIKLEKESLLDVLRNNFCCCRQTVNKSSQKNLEKSHLTIQRDL